MRKRGAKGGQGGEGEGGGRGHWRKEGRTGGKGGRQSEAKRVDEFNETREKTIIPRACIKLLFFVLTLLGCDSSRLQKKGSRGEKRGTRGGGE